MMLSPDQLIITLANQLITFPLFLHPVKSCNHPLQLRFMNKWWWKILCIALLVYTILAGLLLDVPRIRILNETIRNLYFHVCMWFSMMILFTISVVHAVKYLRNNNLRSDILSRQYAIVGIIFGLLGYATGAIWASYLGGSKQGCLRIVRCHCREPKLIGAAIALLIYFAYLVLRDSVSDIDKKARVSSVYNIFAFAFLFPSIWIIPRLLPSLHPGGQGSEGNPA
jgi:heme exporter protein C